MRFQRVATFPRGEKAKQLSMGCAGSKQVAVDDQTVATPGGTSVPQLDPPPIVKRLCVTVSASLARKGARGPRCACVLDDHEEMQDDQPQHLAAAHFCRWVGLPIERRHRQPCQMARHLPPTCTHTHRSTQIHRTMADQQI
jgi:hypothetical protein